MMIDTDIFQFAQKTKVTKEAILIEGCNCKIQENKTQYFRLRLYDPYCNALTAL